MKYHPGMRSQRIQDPGEPLRDRAERNTRIQMQIVIKILQLPVGRIEGQEVLGAGGSRTGPIIVPVEHPLPNHI